MSAERVMSSNTTQREVRQKRGAVTVLCVVTQQYVKVK